MEERLMCSFLYENIVGIIQLLLIVISITLAYLGTRKVLEINTIIKFDEKYSSEEMRENLIFLSDIFRKTEGKTPLQFDETVRVAEAVHGIEKLDRVRREIKFYYYTPARLRRAKLIRKRVFRDLADNYGLEIFLDPLPRLEFYLASKKNDPRLDVRPYKIVLQYAESWISVELRKKLPDYDNLADNYQRMVLKRRKEDKTNKGLPAKK
jgi:hypothetical protein